MGQNFYPVEREQIFLMPPSMRDWLPEDHLAWFVLDVVQQMDLSAIYGKYRLDGHGHPAYEPTMMASLLVYSYSLGVRSSRKIEDLCRSDVAYRVISANQEPDHSAIARFRQRNEEELAGLFVLVLSICAEAGMVKLGVVAIDGTKMKANGALAANRKYESIEKEVKKILEEARAMDEEEDRLYGDKRGDELPPDLANQRTRKARLLECKKRLEREAAEAAAAQEKKIEERKNEEEATGKKRPGRKPTELSSEPDKESKANVTDPDSRIMKTRSCFVQGYNAQAVVSEDQIIIAAEVTQQENDVKQLRPMLESAKESLAAAGIDEPMKAATADAGYLSDENLRDKRDDDPELLIAVEKDHEQRRESSEEKAPRGRIPSDITPRELMGRKLKTKRGKALYKKRGQIVEPVFGHIKSVRGCDGFMRRGLKACESEWKLLCAVSNLLKLWRKVRRELAKGANSLLGGQEKDLAITGQAG